jgi:PAS domain S-box-containing protein
MEWVDTRHYGAASMNELSTSNAVFAAGGQSVLDTPPRLLEMLPIAIYMCDAQGRITGFNRRAVDVWGREPRLGDDTELFCGSHLLFNLSGRPIARHETPTARVLKSGEPIHDLEAIVERPDGTRARVMVHIDPVLSDTGKVLGAINCFHDTTEVWRKEQMLRDGEQRLRDVLEAMPVAVYTTDADGCITFFNEAAVQFAGRRPMLGSDEWCVSWRLYRPDGTPLPHDQCPMATALKEGYPVRGAEAVAERPDGTRIPFIPFPTPLRDASGKITGAINILVDISDRKHAEFQQKNLIDELNHRVKNVLSTVQSFAAQTLRAPKVPKDVRATFEARLFALSRAHDHLTREQWQSADFKSVVQDIFAPYKYIGAVRIRLEGESVKIASHAAMTLSMILHELATNAVKYGALLSAEGWVGVSWHVVQRDDRKRLVIEWEESGGPTVDQPIFTGFGSRLLENGVRQSLKGTVEIVFEPSGVRCTIDIPFPSLNGQ